MPDGQIRDGHLVFNPNSDDTDGVPHTNADLRCEIAAEVGFDFQAHIDERDSNSEHAIYYRVGELAAILNYVRFQQDDSATPVQWPVDKMDVLEELGSRCGFRVERGRLERLQLNALYEEVSE